MGAASTAAALALGAGWFVGLPALVRPHWPAVVDALGGLPGVVTYGTLAVHVVTLLVCNAGFLLLYVARHPAVERYRVSDKPWPWLAGAPQRAEVFALVRLAVGLTALNVVLGFALAFGNVGVMRARGLTVAAAAWPSTWELLWQTLVFILVEDTGFYWAHRGLHSHPALYRGVHKLHHRWHHSLSIAAEATHPLEFVLGNSLPVIAGPLLVGRVHGYTLLQWLAFRIWETCDGHSGYALPWQPFRLLPWAGTAADHEAHHYRNTGNFESFLGVWDAAMGTAIPAGAGKGSAGSDSGSDAPPPPPSSSTPSSRRRSARVAGSSTKSK
jgi:sterol desaturase/sphingolipid hydroxylase (fatty acid hydroxylase superfamily)